ncbi:hypothetical protein GOP47_0002139 [Adiantum capillus-veneris]|uniref:Uncharacterized protein n=1 Tax=Adiantum capillus-veneris TaxID=13818 RepID=A0A9D4V9K9_ADICA|nr:hypothetical protein GOP47_0002139 [Adiantum capillus-veneris]
MYSFSAANGRMQDFLLHRPRDDVAVVDMDVHAPGSNPTWQHRARRRLTLPTRAWRHADFDMLSRL